MHARLARHRWAWGVGRSPRRDRLIALWTAGSIKRERQRTHDLQVLGELIQLTNRAHKMTRDEARWSGYGYLESLSKQQQAPLKWTSLYFHPDGGSLDEQVTAAREKYSQPGGEPHPMHTIVSRSSDPGHRDQVADRSIQNLVFWELVEALRQVRDGQGPDPRCGAWLRRKRPRKGHLV